MALVETKEGNNTVIKSTKSNWIYFVISGRGRFVIKGKKYACSKEDVILVPKDTPFYYQGNLKMLLITVPAWKEKYEVTLGEVSKFEKSKK